MNYPEFFDNIKPIKVRDPLANALGAFTDGMYEITYLDVVKSAGHSCPTALGAYLMAQEALNVLYPEQRAVRGDVKVEFQESLTDGVVGVIANIISHITGATDKSGFKGIGGKFARHSLMDFDSNINSSARFTRVDTGKCVDILYNPSSIPPQAKQQELMQKMMQGLASKEEVNEFGELWQDRVKRIFENSNDVVKVVEL